MNRDCGRGTKDLWGRRLGFGNIIETSLATNLNKCPPSIILSGKIGVFPFLFYI